MLPASMVPLLPGPHQSQAEATGLLLSLQNCETSNLFWLQSIYTLEYIDTAKKKKKNQLKSLSIKKM